MFADGQHGTISSEHDYAQDDGSQILDDASARRRSINSSKRAAQNRAAQRAFRLRRERYVSSLEEKARNYDRLEAVYVDLQRENHQLRVHLQRSLAENAALHAHLATSAPVSPSLSGTLAMPFTPTTPISGTLAQQQSHHQPRTMEPSLYHRQPPQQQKSHALQQQQQHQQQSHHHQSHSLSQDQLRHTGRRSACSENSSSYAFGYTQAARHSPLHTSTSPTSHHHPPIFHSRPPPPSQQQQQPATAPALSLPHRRPQSPSGAQYQQQQHAGILPIQLRREHSLQHPDSNSPPLGATAAGMSHTALSPIQTFGSTRRFESLHASSSAPIALASSAECTSSPSGTWDNGAASMEAFTTATKASPQYRPPPVGSESASSCSSATAAQMLPSVREITMSIGALLPTSPHSDHSPPSRQKLGQDSTASKIDDLGDSKRRPW
ncbi:hypothetical protein GGI20_000116 [Coemansia sp. BCRC 34301]|nr:hypothetical protein GGI20_000116 [Coemansia sp. BCRC 34301]